MEADPDALVIPTWIWVVFAMFVVGVIVGLVIWGDRRNHGHRRRSHRSGGGSRSSGSSRRSRSRSADPFDKL